MGRGGGGVEQGRVLRIASQLCSALGAWQRKQPGNIGTLARLLV